MRTDKKQGNFPVFFCKIFEHLFKKINIQDYKETNMKKVFRLEDLDRANCAATMERAIAKIDGVVSVNISFMSQRMSIEADDERFEEIMDQAAKACKKVEPDCRIIR